MKHLRLLLFPFAIIYGLVIWFRHKCFDWGWLTSTEFDFPVICIGNLSLGGTGKSPMISTLVEVFKEDYHLATLSRGYKRSTEGFRLVNTTDTSKQVGDEPLQFKTSFNEQLTVAVCEQRVKGVNALLAIQPSINAIFLDDAFQHRKIKPGLSILLTTYDQLYVDDFLLPAGNLRDAKYASKRAQIIVVTKCPAGLSKDEKQHIIAKLNPTDTQKVFFARIAYHSHVVSERSTKLLEEFDHFTLVTGIANPQPLVNFLNELGKTFTHLKFPDHHEFTRKELNVLKELKTPVLTTTKDYMRLKSSLENLELVHLPITTELLSNQELFFKEIKDFIDSF